MVLNNHHDAPELFDRTVAVHIPDELNAHLVKHCQPLCVLYIVLGSVF